MSTGNNSVENFRMHSGDSLSIKSNNSKLSIGYEKLSYELFESLFECPDKLLPSKQINPKKIINLNNENVNLEEIKNNIYEFIAKLANGLTKYSPQSSETLHSIYISCFFAAVVGEFKKYFEEKFKGAGLEVDFELQSSFDIGNYRLNGRSDIVILDLERNSKRHSDGFFKRERKPLIVIEVKSSAITSEIGIKQSLLGIKGFKKLNNHQIYGISTNGLSLNLIKYKDDRDISISEPFQFNLTSIVEDDKNEWIDKNLKIVNYLFQIFFNYYEIN